MCHANVPRGRDSTSGKFQVVTFGADATFFFLLFSVKKFVGAEKRRRFGESRPDDFFAKLKNPTRRRVNSFQRKLAFRRDTTQVPRTCASLRQHETVKPRTGGAETAVLTYVGVIVFDENGSREICIVQPGNCRATFPSQLGNLMGKNKLLRVYVLLFFRKM